MTICIIDASVAAKWYLNEVHAQTARRLLNQRIYFHAPDFFLLEMDNVFCKRIRRGDISAKDALDARKLLRTLPIKYHYFGSIQNSAYSIANQTGANIYDCLYVALAVLLGGQMVTADRRLYDGLADGPYAKLVAWVEDVAHDNEHET